MTTLHPSIQLNQLIIMQCILELLMKRGKIQLFHRCSDKRAASSSRSLSLSKEVADKKADKELGGKYFS